MDRNIVTIDGIPVYQALVDSADTGMMRISLVDDPAVQSDFLAFHKQEPARVQAYAIQDEEKRLVLGVVMRADFPIYRRNDDGFEYYIIYKSDTIRQMAEKYLVENRQNLVNLMHEEGTDQDGIHMVQYFIKGGGLSPQGFEGIADGSLFAEFHIDNDDVWKAVKDGTYKGFSLEGVFDLVPETDKDYTQEVVDTLDGIFKRLLTNNQYNRMKKKGILARLAAALVELGNVTTDKGILSWDGDEDLKAGDSVYIEGEDGSRTPAADGDYVTEDGKTIVVVDGKVSAINDPAAQVAPTESSETPAELATTATDKGTLSYEGELAVGTAVTIDGEPAQDGDYTAEDGRTISVEGGIVTAIKEAEAEPAPVENKFQRVAEAMQETFDDKYKALYKAIEELGFSWPWIIEAGEEFCIAEIDTQDGLVYYRFDIEAWNEDGSVTLKNGVKVVPAFVTPEEKEAAEQSFAAQKSEAETLRGQVTALKAELETLKATPAATPAHEEFEGGGTPAKTGVKGLDRLSRIMKA